MFSFCTGESGAFAVTAWQLAPDNSPVSLDECLEKFSSLHSRREMVRSYWDYPTNYVEKFFSGNPSSKPTETLTSCQFEKLGLVTQS